MNNVINLKVDLEKIRQQQKQKALTGMSMQNVVNNAIAKTQAQNSGAQMQLQTPSQWGSK